MENAFTFQEFVNFAILIVVSVLFTRWVFQIGKTLKYHKAQTKLLAQIAAKQAVLPEVIDAIVKEIEEDFVWGVTKDVSSPEIIRKI